MIPTRSPRLRWLFVCGALLVIVATASAITAFARYAGSNAKPAGPAPRTAVIIDQLGTTSPDPEFVWNATATLHNAGYSVDYVAPEQVTVDFFRQLPSRNYGLVLVRAHSGFVYNPQGGLSSAEVRGQGTTFLFTSEPFADGKYQDDVDHARLSEALYFDPPSNAAQLDPDALMKAYQSAPTYFGIKPGFISSAAKGDFPRSTVVLMGCNGLATQSLAKAFIRKGASAVIGWDDLVTAAHTDAATVTLLQRLLVDNQPLPNAVEAAAAIAGPDPVYGGKLVLFQ